MPLREPDDPAFDLLAQVALAAIHRPYPHHLVHVVLSDDDARPPRALTPIFWGAFDWHSAVHGHWALVRLLRVLPLASWAGDARAALAASFTDDGVAGELAYAAAPERAGFELPYGVAWLLALCAELRAWADDGDPDGVRHAATLAPLEAQAAARFTRWLARLPCPLRSGEHPQSAFAMGLALDWARVAGDDAAAALIGSRTRAFYLADTDAPLAWEPSAHDFLSPVLGEADLVRRVLAPADFAAWLARFAPSLGRDGWPTPVVPVDRTDGKLVHGDGLNLSRGWMLGQIAGALPAGDPRRETLQTLGVDNGNAGFGALTAGAMHWAGSHWLASFGVYWLTVPPGRSRAT